LSTWGRVRKGRDEEEMGGEAEGAGRKQWKGWGGVRGGNAG